MGGGVMLPVQITSTFISDFGSTSHALTFKMVQSHVVKGASVTWYS